MTHLRADDGTLYEVVGDIQASAVVDGFRIEGVENVKPGDLIVRRVETEWEHLSGLGKGIEIERCRIVPGGHPGIYVKGNENPGGGGVQGPPSGAVECGSPSPPGTLDALVPRICTILARRAVEGPSLRVAIAEEIDSAIAAALAAEREPPR